MILEEYLFTLNVDEFHFVFVNFCEGQPSESFYSYAQFMRSLCAVYAQFMRSLCAVYAQFMRSLCAVYAQFIYT